MCQPVGLSVHRSVHPPVGRFIRPSILRLSINASVCLSVSPSVRSMFVKKDPLSSHSSPSQMNTTNTIISRSQARTKTMQPMTEDSPLAVWALFRWEIMTQSLFSFDLSSLHKFFYPKYDAVYALGSTMACWEHRLTWQYTILIFHEQFPGPNGSFTLTDL